MSTRRLGLIVPSSNTTMETEIPELLGRHAHTSGQRFTTHSSRAVLHTVDPQSLHRMVGEGDRCATELADAHVEAIGYACLIALMAEGARAHERIEPHLAEIAARENTPTPVVSSAGALVRTILELGLSRVAIVTPYLPELTEMVIRYLNAYDVEVVDSVSLGVPDNIEVGNLDPARLPEHVEQLDLTRAEGLVLSACVQMPSLPAVDTVERKVGLPVLTAATSTTRELLRTIGVEPVVAEAGAALA